MKELHQAGDIIAQRYRILDILGQGGNGITYKAQELESGKRVALKALSLRHMGDWKQMELFEREAKILAQLNHPGIPRYLDYFTVDTSEDRAFYLAQQLVEGQSLGKLVENGWRTNEKGVRRIAAQVLEILSYLHDFHPPVIHRDIKPQNLILANFSHPLGSQIFLVDFGAVQDTYHSTLTGGSTVIGTFGYMAPEQFRGQALPATDLYGLGATLLFLLTHRSPADIPTDRLKINFRYHVQISPELANFLEKMLEPDIKDRFQSASEALEALNNQPIVTTVQPSLSRPWKSFTALGIIAVVGVSVLNYFKYPLLDLIGFTPVAIYEAAEKGDIDTVAHYLERGLNPNIKDERGITPLHEAESKEVAELLIAQGADINVRDKFGFTPLHFTKSPEVAALLISLGADVNAKNTNDIKTLLPPLSYQPQFPLSDQIINQFGRMPFHNIAVTPLHMAQNQEIATLLIAKGADVHNKTNLGNTPLHMVRFPEVASLLISQGVDVNIQNNSGLTPLHTVFLQTYEPLFSFNEEIIEEMVRILLIQGANINAKDKKHNTPLHLAIPKFNQEMIEMLLTNGADVNAKDKDSKTPLHLALESYRDNEIVKMLLTKEVDINAKDKDGKTPLHFAAKYFMYKEIVEILLNQGADINAKDKDGKTPLHFAIKNHSNKEVVEILLNQGADINLINIHDVLTQEEALSIISNVDIKSLDNQGNTLLHKAARNDWKELVEILLDEGIDVNAKNNEGNTPLRVAGNNKEVVKIIKNYGGKK